MSGMTLGLLLQAALVTTGANEIDTTYDAAYTKMQKSGKPLLVLVSANWCPACRKMKETTLPKLHRDGQLKKVEFATVDLDQEKKLSNRLMKATTIPQLILFTKTADGWKREQIIGAQKVDAIKQFVQVGVQRVAKAREKAALK